MAASGANLTGRPSSGPARHLTTTMLSQAGSTNVGAKDKKWFQSTSKHVVAGCQRLTQPFGYPRSTVINDAYAENAESRTSYNRHNSAPTNLLKYHVICSGDVSVAEPSGWCRCCGEPPRAGCGGEPGERRWEPGGRDAPRLDWFASCGTSAVQMLPAASTAPMRGGQAGGGGMARACRARRYYRIVGSVRGWCAVCGAGMNAGVWGGGITCVLVRW